MSCFDSDSSQLRLTNALPSSLVLGPGKGHLKTLFAKAATLHVKKGFSFAIAVGNLFGPEDDDEVNGILVGTIQVPLLTYFTVGTDPLPPRVVAKITADEEV